MTTQTPPSKMEGRLPIKFHFGPPRDENGTNFSEIEKMPTAMGEADEEEEGEALVEEQCCALWNQIKDATVLEGSGDLSDALLTQLQFRAELVAAQIGPRGSENARLRLACVWTALGELKKRKARAEMANWMMMKGEEGEDGGGMSRAACMAQFRRWLHQQEAEVARIRARIPHSKNSIASLRELELEQKAQQEQIQTEGRAKHQQLCSSSIEGEDAARHHPLGREDRLCEVLEQRYLALWLASLESLELIKNKARLAEKCSEENSASDLEEGPDPKRRKTSTEEEEKFGEKAAHFEEVAVMSGGREEQQMKHILLRPQQALAQKMTTGLAGGGGRQQMLGSDIGYSSGENNSVHDEGTTTNTNSVEENHLEEQPQSARQEPDDKWAEQIALSSELEKSFYRTVPLDEFGMTDLDTDDGQWPRSSYLAQKFMDGVEKGGPALELTDSLIVHVDAPDSRQLNDFEEVMDLLDQQVENHRPAAYCFSEDDCESGSTGEEGERRRYFGGGGTIGTRKRALAKPPMGTKTNSGTGADLVGRRRPRREAAGRRKWAAVRKSRSSNDGCWTMGATTGAAAGLWSSGNYLSSDFEWDEDFGDEGIGRRRGGGTAEGRRHQLEDGREEEEEMVVLPDIHDHKQGGEEEELLMARKKALCAFREGLRQAAMESGNVNARLRQMLGLVDNALGGVDSAAYLLAELKSTFTALSGLCHALERRMGGRQFWEGGTKTNGGGGGEEKENGGGGGAIQIGHIQDIHAELMLCHERMNALETTCNNLALLLGTHLTERGADCCPGQPGQYLGQFAVECNRIREEVEKLKNRFGDKFLLCSIIQLPDMKGEKEAKEEEGPKVEQKCSSTTINVISRSEPVVVVGTANRREASFWRSYLLLCLLGFVASLGTLLYANSAQSSADWRWSFGPQLHYENGPPPI